MAAENIDFDSILDKLGATGAPAPGGSDPMMQMMMMQMQADRADRRASRDTTMQMLMTVLPALLPLLFKKDADPVMMTLLQGMMSKSNDGEQTKNMLQMMQVGNQMTMDQMKNALMSIMEMKDAQTKKMLEDARSGNDDDAPASGPAAILHELRMGISAIGGMLPAPAVAAPAQAVANLPAPGTNPPAQRQRQPPVVVVLHQLMMVQTGKIPKTRVPACLAGMVTVALQDEALIEALDAGIQEVVAYCLPHIQSDAALMAWVSTAGVPEWVDAFVTRRLQPLVDAALDDGEGEDGAGDGDELHSLDAANTSRVPTPVPGGSEPETLDASNTKA